MRKVNKSRFAVLGMLSLKPSSGYSIKKMIQGSTAHFWREGDSSIYPILRELVKEGCVRSPQKRGKRNLKVYTITGKGEKELKQWLAAPIGVEPVRHELLLKLFFGNEQSKEKSRDHLLAFQRRLLDAKENYSRLHEQLISEYGDREEFTYWLMTLRYGQLYTEMALRWSEECLENL